MTPQEYQKMLAANPDLRGPDYTTRTEAATSLRSAGDLGGATPAYRLTPAEPSKESEREKLAAQFEYLWRIWQGPELTKEHRFYTTRQWRLDYYHAATNTGIELEGGVWAEGRHTRGSGFLSDIEKYNAAAMLGITVLRLGTGQVDHQHVTEFIEYIKRQEAQP